MEENHRRPRPAHRTPQPLELPLIRRPGPARISRLVRGPPHAARAGRFRRIRPDADQHVAAGPICSRYVQDALDEIEYAPVTPQQNGARQRSQRRPPRSVQDPICRNRQRRPVRPPRRKLRRSFRPVLRCDQGEIPRLQLIATTPVQSRTPDVIDDHYYRSSRAMERDVHHYDKTDRNGPKIFVGEWATTEGRPTPNLNAALADAAWLTGLERNSDIVVMNLLRPAARQREHQRQPMGHESDRIQRASPVSDRPPTTLKRCSPRTSATPNYPSLSPNRNPTSPLHPRRPHRRHRRGNMEHRSPIQGHQGHKRRSDSSSNPNSPKDTNGWRSRGGELERRRRRTHPNHPIAANCRMTRRRSRLGRLHLYPQGPQNRRQRRLSHHVPRPRPQ